MNITDIKNKITAVSDSELTLLIADNWSFAQYALNEIDDAGYRETSVAQYPLQLLCMIVCDKGGFHEHSSADKECIVEKMKAVFNPVAVFLDSNVKLDMPTYSLVTTLIPQDTDKSFFAYQLKEDFKRLNQDAADALATALYAVVYACYEDFDDGVVSYTLRQLVDDSYDIGNFARTTEEEQLGTLNEATKNVYGTGQTNASTAYTSASTFGNSGSTYHSAKHTGKWLPLKIYLIVTTLFVALVFGLVFWSMSSGVGSSSMSIMNTSGQMVAIEPGMKPVTLFLFGTVDYDELIYGIKNTVFIFVMWRAMLLAIVYIFNARRRRNYNP